MHLRREWLIGKRARVSGIQQSADLFDIAQSVAAIDKNAVAILHLFGCQQRKCFGGSYTGYYTLHVFVEHNTCTNHCYCF